jgi:hypothetical protein
VVGAAPKQDLACKRLLWTGMQGRMNDNGKGLCAHTMVGSKALQLFSSAGNERGAAAAADDPSWKASTGPPLRSRARVKAADGCTI